MRDSIDENGYVVIPDALDARTVSRLLRAFDDPHAPVQNDGTQHVELAPSTAERGTWEALREHPIVRKLAEHVLRVPFTTTELHGRNPLPGYGQQGLHADAAPRATVEPWLVLTAIWILDDFTIENGATRVVPGTHRLLGPVPKSFAQPAARHPGELVVTARAGSVLVMNGHTWHSGRKNASNGPRRAGQMVLRVGSTRVSSG